MEKDLPWRMKDSRVLEILQAVGPPFSSKVVRLFPFPRAMCLEFLFVIHFVCLIEQIDSNTDGLVDFSEFVAATLHVHQLEEHDTEKWQNRSQAAFEKFDVDRDGYITPEELKLVSTKLLFPSPNLKQNQIINIVL